MDAILCKETEGADVALAKLKITKSGQSGVLVMGMGKDRRWYMEQPVAWFPASSGRWVRVANATKFRQFTFLRILDENGTSIVNIAEPPYRLGMKFTANLVQHLSVFEVDGEEFEVDPIVVPPPKKTFQIRENFDVAASYAWVQGETAGMEIQDPATGATASYLYKGIGLSLPIPLPKIKRFPKLKLPTVLGGATTPGDWNDFEAPGWMGVGDFEGDAMMQTIYSLGPKSFTVFDFAGNVDDRRGYLVHITSFSTGTTYSLPSSGFTSGSMNLTPASEPEGPKKQRLGGCGKFCGMVR
jgi:hypothetical protein